MTLQYHIGEPLLAALFFIIIVLIPQTVNVAFVQAELAGEDNNAARIQEENLSLTRLNIFIGAASAVAGAIGGGFFGAYFTARNGEKMERVKAEEYKQSVRILIKSELEDYYDLVTGILKNGEKEPDQPITVDKELRTRIAMTRELKTYYEDIRVESKAQVFEPKLLKKLESIYDSYRIFFYGDYDESLTDDRVYFRHKVIDYKNLLEEVIQMISTT